MRILTLIKPGEEHQLPDYMADLPVNYWVRFSLIYSARKKARCHCRSFFSEQAESPWISLLKLVWKYYLLGGKLIVFDQLESTSIMKRLPTIKKYFGVSP